jgi:hypothetical protein
MSQYVETGVKTLTCAGALAQYQRVVYTAGSCVVATAGQSMVGTVEAPTFTGDTTVAVRLRSAQGTRKMIASEAITAGNYVYAAADGEVAADGSIIEGVALEAATADQDIIEVLLLDGAGATGGILNAAQQALSGAGAINVTTYYTAWTTTGANAGTLAAGTFPGQLKKVKQIVDGGVGTLTPTAFTNGTSIAFEDAGDYAVLLWDGDSWTAVELGNDADGATAPTVNA